MARLHGFAACALCLAVVFPVCDRASLAQSATLPTTASPPSTSSAPPSAPATASTRVPLDTIADVQMARGSYAAALATFQQIQPRTAEVWNKMGVAYHHLYAFDQAMTCYRQASAMDPHFAEAYNNIGAVYYSRLRFSAAVNEYKRSLKYKPRAAVTYLNLGTAYFAEAKYKRGVEEYRRALKIDPDIFDPAKPSSVDETGTQEQRMEKYFYVAEIYASFGRTQDALASLRKAFSEGFRDRKRLREDKELASLRDTPEFHQLLIQEHLE
jgi:tetratricopeptide (TPR) repeat protein